MYWFKYSVHFSACNAALSASTCSGISFTVNLSIPSWIAIGSSYFTDLSTDLISCLGPNLLEFPVPVPNATFSPLSYLLITTFVGEIFKFKKSELYSAPSATCNPPPKVLKKCCFVSKILSIICLYCLE